jgi:hypothetical protein
MLQSEMSRRIGSAVAVAGGLLIAVSCAARPRDAVHFDGRARPSFVSPGMVRQVEALPSGYDSLGKVAAGCRATEGQTRIDGAWLCDVDCNSARLVGALRERAAAVGGDLLIGLRCGSQVHKDALRQVDVSCSAEVGRPGYALMEERPMASETEKPAQEEASPTRFSDAWRIRVDFTPAPVGSHRSPLRGDLVRELDYLPPSHVSMGDVVTRCEESCRESSLRSGLRTVAGRGGATDVVDVRCVQRGLGLVCSATAAGYQVDPDTDPRAR